LDYYFQPTKGDSPQNQYFVCVPDEINSRICALFTQNALQILKTTSNSGASCDPIKMKTITLKGVGVVIWFLSITY
jgi:hypothetical protein